LLRSSAVEILLSSLSLPKLHDERKAQSKIRGILPL